MEDSQKLDYILANMATKEDLVNFTDKVDIILLGIRDDLAQVSSDIMTEIDREQRLSEQYFECVDERLDSLQNAGNIMGLVYKNVNLIRKSVVDLHIELESVRLPLGLFDISSHPSAQ